MANRRMTSESLAWMGTLALGSWLSVKVARWIAGSVPLAGGSGRAGRADEPVREIVEEILSEHRADDTPVVHAFEEALESEEEERERAH